MLFDISGDCPVQNKQVSIPFTAHESKSLTQTKYIRGMNECDYHQKGLCNIDSCPVFDRIPENFDESYVRSLK